MPAKSQSAILVGQNSVNCYIQVVVVALLSVVLVGFVILVSVVLVVDCTYTLLSSLFVFSSFKFLRFTRRRCKQSPISDCPTFLVDSIRPSRHFPPPLDRQQ